MKPYYQTAKGDFLLYEGDCREVVPRLPSCSFNAVFADPPYFLSNDGFSVQAGKRVSVNKGAWDKSHGLKADTEFNFQWIKACRERLSESGTIWICGTFHNIFAIATVLSELDFRILNSVTWQKTNPPPNLSCRFFTHSTEILLWARKQKRVPHYYNYDLMRRLAGGRQMTDVWRLPAIGRWEKSCGKHPTQKPLSLVVRALLASTEANALVLDPFAGSSTTGIAANLINRKFVGVESTKAFLELSKKRRIEYEKDRDAWYRRIPDFTKLRDSDKGKDETMQIDR